MRSTHPELFCKKTVLKTFVKLKGKYLCQSLFYHKFVVCNPGNSFKRGPSQVFSCEFSEISQNNFFWRTALIGCLCVSSGVYIPPIVYKECTYDFDEVICKMSQMSLFTSWVKVKGKFCMSTYCCFINKWLIRVNKDWKNIQKNILRLWYDAF